MPYRFEEGEDAQFALRRCAREQLDTAIERLSSGRGDPAEDVHEARKALKKSRSLLRLALGSLPDEQRRRENAALREVAATLGASRDTDAMIEALDQLADRYSGQVPSSTFGAIKSRLERDRDAGRAGPESSAATARAVEELKAVRERVEDWSLRRDGWRAVERGLNRAYAGGSERIHYALDHRTPDALHEARKRGKDLWYQLRLLESVCPEVVGGHAELAHHLTEALGDDHDLVLLHELLHDAAGDLTVDVDAVLALVEHRREQLQSDAFLLAARCYAEDPKAFLRRMRRYWKAREAHTELVAASRPAELAELTRHPLHA